MWIKQVRMTDFRCFYGEQIIEFAQNVERNVTVIHAENGVGKTTLLNAILWCFYGIVTGRFEQKEDLVNYDARAAGRTRALVEVFFEHNGNRYWARRYSKSAASDRDFMISRVDDGHQTHLEFPDTFINTVMPKSMAGHFLFDGEHAEIFLGEDNRAGIRSAIQDILGCSLIKTAIGDLQESATYFRKQMASRRSSDVEQLSNKIDAIVGQIETAETTLNEIVGEIDKTEQQVADIDLQLRNSAAAKELQARRERAQGDLAKARKRAGEGHAARVKWIGDNGRYLVSKRIAEIAFDFLDSQETKGRLPSPYNEEFVNDLLGMEVCICGADLKAGSPAHAKVQGLLQKAANAVLRSRITKIRAQLSRLKSERNKAPARFSDINERLAEALEDISRYERELEDVSSKLTGIDFDDIAQREKRRNELRKEIARKTEGIGVLKQRIQDAHHQRAAIERELSTAAAQDREAKVFHARYNLCETLKGRLEKELKEEEAEARRILLSSVRRVLEQTSRKSFRVHMSSDYSISLTNEAGTQLPRSSGENQLLGLAFTAALVEFAKLRQNAENHMLLRGTVAPLVLDSPFGQLDESYRETTAECIPSMAGQIILMVSKSQASAAVMKALGGRIGKEYVMVRHNKSARSNQRPEVRQIGGKDFETAVFDAPFDGSSLVVAS
jgi:DNA sulfur modification protein DndD